jgi:hypothetical protein
MERELGDIKAMFCILIMLVFMRVNQPILTTGAEMPKDEVLETCACGYTIMYFKRVPKADRDNK